MYLGTEGVDKSAWQDVRSFKIVRTIEAAESFKQSKSHANYLVSSSTRRSISVPRSRLFSFVWNLNMGPIKQARDMSWVRLNKDLMADSARLRNKTELQITLYTTNTFARNPQ